MRTFTIVFPLLIAASNCFAEYPQNILSVNQTSNAYEMSILADMHLAAAIATNTSASFYHRSFAMHNITNNTYMHAEILRVLASDSDLDIRVMAAEALTEVDPDTARSSAKQTIEALSRAVSGSNVRHSPGLRSAVLLARLRDPSGFQYVIEQLFNANRPSDQSMALTSLSEFGRFPELPTRETIIIYIEKVLPLLEVEEQSKRAERHLTEAFSGLYKLRAVDALPRMKQWEPVLPPKLQWILQYHMRRLEQIANMDNPNEDQP